MVNRARRRKRRRRIKSLLGVAAVLWLARRWQDGAATKGPDGDGVMDKTRGYPKRTYPDLSAFLADLRAMLADRELMGNAMRNVDPAFRTRLMLAVTQVNGCRYCSFYHAQVGLREGLSQAEVDDLLAGVSPDDHASIPREEAVALFYAQHFAESGGSPETSARERLVDTYGGEKAEQIEMLLRAITMGNLMGNTFDYILFRLGLIR